MQDDRDSGADDQLVTTEKRLRRVFREELVTTASHDRPPPADIDGEQDVVSAILCEAATHAELDPLSGEHFYSTLHARVFECARHTVDLERIATAAENKGFRGPLLEDLHVIRDAVPYCNLPTLQATAWRLIEFTKRRRLIRVLHDLNAGLRDATTYADAVRELAGVDL